MTFLLPETKGVTLPETIEEAENLRKGWGLWCWEGRCGLLLYKGSQHHCSLYSILRVGESFSDACGFGKVSRVAGDGNRTQLLSSARKAETQTRLLSGQLSHAALGVVAIVPCWFRDSRQLFLTASWIAGSCSTLHWGSRQLSCLHQDHGVVVHVASGTVTSGHVLYQRQPAFAGHADCQSTKISGPPGFWTSVELVSWSY